MAIVRQNRDNPMPLDVMIRKFNKAVERDGILEDMSRKEYAMSKSEYKKYKREQAAKRAAQTKSYKKRYSDGD